MKQDYQKVQWTPKTEPPANNRTCLLRCASASLSRNHESFWSRRARLVYHGSAAEAPEDEKPIIAVAAKEANADKPQARTDVLGDPLPDGTIARLGTRRFRHGGLIRFTAFTPDGRRLVSQGDDGVRVWDVATGRELRHFAPPPEKNWAAADLSADGKMMAGSIDSADGHIDFWDIDSGKKTSSDGQGYYALIRLSPDGKRLAAFESAHAPLRAVELWDVASPRKLRSWKPHGRQQVLSLAFSADSRNLLTNGGDGKVRLWDMENGQQLQEFTRLDWKLGESLWFFNQNEALSPDGKLLALVELNEKGTSKTDPNRNKARISLRDTTTGKEVSLLTYSHTIVSRRAPDFSALTFTPDSKKLITGGPDRFLRVRDLTTGEELRRWPLEMACPYSLTLSKDGKTLAAVLDQGKSIQLLDMTTGKPPSEMGGHRTGLGWSALTPDNRTAVTVGLDELLLWDVAESRIRHRLKEHKSGIAGMQLARDGRSLYTLGWDDKTVSVWDLTKGEEPRRFPLDQEYMPSAFGALALSPDGGRLAVLSSKTIRVLDATSGRELRRFAGPEWVAGSAFAADSRSLVVWSGDLKVGIWDTITGRLLHEYSLPQELRIGQPINPSGASPTFYHAALSPDGRLLAVGNNRHTLPLEKCFLVFKDLTTGREIRRFDHLAADVYRPTFSPDGRVLAWSSSKDWSIRLMETASGRERCCFSGHRGQVYSLAFSTDGGRLISGSNDTTALVWDLGRRIDPRPAPPALTKAELDVLWFDLAAEDAVRAYRAIRKLAATPNAAVPFVRKRLRPLPSVEEKRIARRIAELDSEDFAVRQKAATELQIFGEQALPAYRKALDGKPSLETRRRVDELLEKAQRAWWDVSGERLRSLRAVEALELAGTKEARELLETLAVGAEGARLTAEAKAALQRLASRKRDGSP